MRDVAHQLEPFRLVGEALLQCGLCRGERLLDPAALDEIGGVAGEQIHPPQLAFRELMWRGVVRGHHAERPAATVRQRRGLSASNARCDEDVEGRRAGEVRARGHVIDDDAPLLRQRECADTAGLLAHVVDGIEERLRAAVVRDQRQTARAVVEMNGAHPRAGNLRRRAENLFQQDGQIVSAGEHRAELVQTRHAEQVRGGLFARDSKRALGLFERRHVHERQRDALRRRCPPRHTDGRAPGTPARPSSAPLCRVASRCAALPGLRWGDPRSTRVVAI